MANEVQGTDGDGGHNIDGLLRKNSELLAEVRGLKTRIAELEGERDTARGAAQEAEQTTQRILVEEPLERLLSGAFVVPWRVVRPLLDEHFSAGLTEGRAQVTARTSEAAMPLSPEGSAAILREIDAIPDLAALVRPPTGGGARGSDAAGRSAPPARTDKPIAATFGLR